MLDVIRTNNYVYIILEYCADGNLKKYLAKKKENRLSEVDFLIISRLKQYSLLNILLKVSKYYMKINFFIVI